MMNLGLHNRYRRIRIGACGGWTYSKDKHGRMGEVGDEESLAIMPLRLLSL